MKNTTKQTQVRQEYAAPKLQQIEMSETAAAANPGGDEGVFASAS